MAIEAVLQQVLRMPAEERAELVERLIDSLGDDEVEISAEELTHLDEAIADADRAVECGELTDAGLTAAGERPGGPVALLAHSTVGADRNPRCATWSRLPGRDATALSAWTRKSRTRIHGLLVDQVDQYPAAVRD